MWCGPCLCLRVGVSSCVGGGVVGSAEGREEVVTHHLTAQTAHVHSTGGDKQVLNVHTWTHTRTGTYIHTHMDGHTYTHGDCLQHIVIPMSMHAHADTHTHTSISTHDKVTQITFTHSRYTNVTFSLTSIYNCSDEWAFGQ